MRPLTAGLAAFLVVSLLMPVGLSQLTPGWSRPRPAPALMPAPLGSVWAPRGPVTRHELTATRLGHTIAGHLVSPGAGADVAVVLVAGAGRSTRDDMLAEAVALAARGLHAVSYDKTRAGYSWRHRDFAALAADLAAVVAVTRQVTGAARVGVLGFSEGSWIAARTAAAPEAPDFLILASAPIVTPLEQSAWIVDRQMGALPEPVRRVPASLLAAGRTVLDYLDEDPRPHLAAGDQPVLAVWGAEDVTVPVTTAAQRLTESVSRAVTVLILPGVGHRLEDRSGWADHVADWLRAKPPVTDQVRGASPADGHGVPGLPRWTGPLTFLSLFGATLAAVAAAAYVRRPSRHLLEQARVRS